jgi:hypothetical protein
VRRLALALALLLAAACEDTSYRDIGAEIRILTDRTDALVMPALQRLAKYHRRAVPQIEIALHTASASGKVNLIHALDAIAEPESAAVLRHFAVYDPDVEVRGACEEVLTGWARRPGAVGAAAGRALAQVGAQRAAGEAPVVVGEPSK